jgi:hypothetical protein
MAAGEELHARDAAQFEEGVAATFAKHASLNQESMG